MNPESRTLVCFALKEEAAPFRKLAAGKAGVSLLFTGIGRDNARRTVGAEIARQRPTLVLTCGFAGALAAALTVGDVIFETADAPLRQKLERAGAKPVKLFCADRIASTAAEKNRLRAETGADAVEMESAAIHALCREQGVPCATVRVISDVAGEDLPLDFNQLAKPDRSLDYGKLLRAVAGSPGKIGGLLRLQKHARLAAGELAAILARVID
jgi:adenosylhomocysteine nucleosidase